VDLSYVLAKQLGFIKKGVIKLDMETNRWLGKRQSVHGALHVINWNI